MRSQKGRGNKVRYWGLTPVGSKTPHHSNFIPFLTVGQQKKMKSKRKLMGQDKNGLMSKGDMKEQRNNRRLNSTHSPPPMEGLMLTQTMSKIP